MKKNSLIKENIEKIRRVSKKMPKSINEAMTFEGDDDFDYDDEIVDEPEHHEEKPESGQLDVMEFVDDIRKKSLRGMAQLADNPDDERYQLLKKIWQICDKKPEQQTAFSNPNQQNAQQHQINGGNQRI